MFDVIIGPFLSAARYVNEISDQLFIEYGSIVPRRPAIEEMNAARTLDKKVRFRSRSFECSSSSSSCSCFDSTTTGTRRGLRVV